MGRTWFITGASSGFGYALAETVLKLGERAVLAARRIDRMKQLATCHPQRAIAVNLDVNDAEQRNRAIEVAVKEFGRIDVLANVAGRGSVGAAEEFTLEQLREQMEVNFFATVELTRQALPTMRRQGSGHILQLTSIGGLVAAAGFGPYCASKFALEGWSESLREEVGPLGIKVTIVEPGAFRTEFAGARNMRPNLQLDAYRPVIAPVQAYLDESDGQQPGDPLKAAAAMIAVVNSENPPLRLQLGKDALEMWDKKHSAFDSELSRWRRIGEATSYEESKSG